MSNNIKRAWVVTDSHFGVRNSSVEWTEIHRDYFLNFLIPKIKEQYRLGDILIHGGDVYDSRQSINLRVLNLGILIFEELSKIFVDGIYIIAGNHDCANRSSNEINSLKSLKWIPNIHIMEEPKLHKFSGKDVLFMPWRKDHNQEAECLNEFDGADYLFCHTDIRGLKFNKYTEVEEGNDISVFNKYKKVYSGHIHYRQKEGHVVMMGSPYQLTRSDAYNDKGFYLLDFENGSETFFLNDHSPQFIKLRFVDLLELTIPQIESAIKNNFVDVLIDGNLVLKTPMNLFNDLVTGYRRLDFQVMTNNEEMNSFEHLEGKSFDLVEFVKEYIATLSYDQITKDKILASIQKLYKKAESEINSKEKYE